jgi:hypothetical protein
LAGPSGHLRLELRAAPKIDSAARRRLRNDHSN